LFWIGGNGIKTFAKVVLLVFVLIICILAIVAFRFRGEIKAYIIAKTTSSEEILNNMNNTMDPQTLLKDYNDINIRDLTEEEQKKLANDELSEDQIIDLITGSTKAPDPQPDNQENQDQAPTVSDQSSVTNNDSVKDPLENIQQHPEQRPPEKQSDAEKNPEAVENNTENQEIARLVAQLYVVKSRSKTALADLKKDYSKRFWSLSKTEREAKKKDFMLEILDIVSEWEKNCDAEVEGILSQISELRKKSGQDNSLVDLLRKAYQQEKVYTKAYYLEDIS
jgi:uncharacterized protein (DUF433 family)